MTSLAGCCLGSVTNRDNEPVVNAHDSLFHGVSICIQKKQIAFIIKTENQANLNFIDIICQNASNGCIVVFLQSHSCCMHVQVAESSLPPTLIFVL